ncbi:MAG: hypothetical protein NXI04_13315 [Planctomycetaceae bacterium]|nr:hypothetical protein [Planctomycetaceae bacterium]
MTTLRFAGELPLIPGLLLAIIVAIMAWRFYRRESRELSPAMRWLLPGLRASAFLLGILILTGPVLHHRTTLGEPGRVKVYVDGSQSMGLEDRHLSLDRKLRIARQQGWLDEGRIDFSLADTADSLQRLHTEWNRQTAESTQAPKAAEELLAALQQLDTTAVTTADPVAAVRQQLQPLSEGIVDTDAISQVSRSLQVLINTVRSEFATSVQQRLAADSGAIATSLDLFDQSSRWQRLQRGLQSAETSLIAQLREHHDVEVITLAGHEALTQVLPPADAVAGSQSDATPEIPNAPLTDLTSGLASQHTAVPQDTRQAGRSAVVLLTDGRHNSGPSPLETAQLMGAAGTPFFPVSFGAATAPGDLVLKSAQHAESVFAADTLAGTLFFDDTMPPGQPITVRIRQRQEVVWEQSLNTTGQGSRSLPFQFAVQPLVDASGQWQSASDDVRQHSLPVDLTAEILPLLEEAESANNTTALRVAVVTQPSRILLLDGRSRWETRYLRNAFERDSQWKVNVIVAGPGTDTPELPRGDQPGQFPATKESLLDFDLIILGELTASLLAEHEYTWIREFVQQRGGGLILVDGSRQRLREQTAAGLLDLIPVEWTQTASERVSKALQLTAAGRGQPELLLAAADGNEQLWSQLPPPRRVIPVTPLADAQVLVEAAYADDTRLPALITRQSGGGRVLYFAWDETWRWRYKNADTYHQRFWNQVARFVMPEPFAASDDYVSLDAGSVAYDFGDRAQIRVQLRGADGRPATDATVDALLLQGGDVISTVSLTADENVPGRYRGTSGELLQSGLYEVSVRASGYSSDALKARASFTVRAATSTELTETSCNESLLQQIAVASGGSYLREEQLNQLPALLQPLSGGRIIESDTVLWQSYWWFSAILLLLTAEWWLRKRVGLL